MLFGSIHDAVPTAPYQPYLAAPTAVCSGQQHTGELANSAAPNFFLQTEMQVRYRNGNVSKGVCPLAATAHWLRQMR